MAVQHHQMSSIRSISIPFLAGYPQLEMLRRRSFRSFQWAQQPELVEREGETYTAAVLHQKTWIFFYCKSYLDVSICRYLIDIWVFGCKLLWYICIYNYIYIYMYIYIYINVYIYIFQILWVMSAMRLHRHGPQRSDSGTLGKFWCGKNGID